MLLCEATILLLPLDVVRTPRAACTLPQRAHADARARRTNDAHATASCSVHTSRTYIAATLPRV
ncbi:hypothetical protein EON66_10350 [archaeon]|nr:MAG: hypothetical protein EON66_10350 [archaeon]